jgi:membrane protein YdbS with pleckstrin-like domain
VLLDDRCHGIVLARPLAWAASAAIAAAAALAAGWPLSLLGPVLLAAAAGVALRAVFRWERTRIVVTTDRVLVVGGLLRRRAVAVPIGTVASVELDQSLAGRLLGYGTLVVGPIEVSHVASPRRVVRLVEQLCG